MSAESMSPGQFGNISNEGTPVDAGNAPPGNAVDNTASTDVSAAPADVSAAPAEVSAAPAEVSAAPAEVSAPPAEVSAPPAENVSSNTNTSSNTSSNTPSNSSANTAPPPAKSSSGYTMSAKAQSVLNGRMETLRDMQAEYKRVFGDDKKAPKAKSYEAFALYKIRTTEGEDAYKAKLQEFVERNQGKSANPTAKTAKKGKKVANNSAAPSAAKPNNTTQKVNTGTNKLMAEAVKTMADSAHGLLDTIVKTVNAFAAAKTPEKQAALANEAISAANSGSATKKAKKPRKPRASRKKGAVLPPVAEENFNNTAAD